MNQTLNNYFHILVPYYGAWTKYGWPKNDWGIGLETERIDELAKIDSTIVVRYGKDKQEYTIAAKKVQKYPVERVKDYDTWVYIVQKSVLNYRAKKTEDEKMREFSEIYL